MYVKYFGLRQSPFRTAPDPEYFFASALHLRAVDRVVHAIRERAGLVLILGGIGLGKSTICRYVQKRYADEFFVGYMGNPFLNVQEFGEQILQEFGVVASRRTSQDIVRNLSDFLLDQEYLGRIPVLFLDEAQLLSPDILEFLLIVTNIQYRGKHLLQVVLAGQNEFQETLRHPRFASLNQRLGTRIQLRNLNKHEVIAYITFRLDQAGVDKSSLFSLPAMVHIWRVTQGNPRLINQLGEHLLEQAYEKRSQRVRRKDVLCLMKDPVLIPVLFPGGTSSMSWIPVTCALCLFLVVMLGNSSLLQNERDIPLPTPPMIATALIHNTDQKDALLSTVLSTQKSTGGKDVTQSNSLASQTIPTVQRTIVVSDNAEEVQRKLEKILQFLEKQGLEKPNSASPIPLGIADARSVSRNIALNKMSIPNKERKFPVLQSQPKKKTDADSGEKDCFLHTHRTVEDEIRGNSLPSPIGIHVDAIVWDTEPQFRLAVVNAQIVRAGNTVGDGYVVEKIYRLRIKFSKNGLLYEAGALPRRGTRKK